MYIKDKIEIEFHDDDAFELTILDMLNSETFKRDRKYFIKRVLIEYFKKTNDEKFEKIFNKNKEIAAKKEKLQKIFGDS